MAITIDFPSNPALNQEYTFAGKKWKYNGTGWVLVASVAFVPYTGATNNLDMGSFGITADYYSYNTATVIPSAVGRTRWNVDSGTIDIGMGYPDVIQQVGMDTFYPPVKNQTGSLITKGTAVMAVGTLGASGRILVAPAIADGSIPSRFMLGITKNDMADGEDGIVSWFGEMKGFNTVAKAPVGETWVDGDVLWLNPAIAGGLTKNEPSAPNLKVSMAQVIHAATNGIIVIRPSLGMKLTDLHDVNAFTPVTNNLIAYNGNKWVTRSFSDLDLTTFTQVENVVIPSASFTLVSGLYEASISNVLISATSVVDIIPVNASYTVVKNAEFLPQTDSFSGSVKVYCVNAPASDITVTLNIVNT